MAAALYTLDDRSVTGLDEVDAQHRRLAGICAELEQACRRDDFEAARDTFARLQDALLTHFATEERLIEGFLRLPGVKAHLFRHRANHLIVRQHLEAAARAFDAAAAGDRRIPNLTLLVPKVYFDQMKDVDAEMTDLLAKFR